MEHSGATPTVILLADDVHLFLEQYCPFFKRKGVEVLTATDGAQALQLIQTKHPDIAILDYFMPQMTGAEVCRQVKADPALKHIPIVILTSERRPDVVTQCQAAGCEEILFKPISPKTLLDKAVDLLALPTRRLPRIPIQIRLRGTWEEEPFRGQTIDLSEGGVLLETDFPLRVGVPVRIRFSLPHTAETIVAEGEVVREAEAGAAPRYAIEFTSLVEGQRQAIGRFVETQLQQESGG